MDELRRDFASRDQLVDLLIEPDVKKYSSTNFSAYKPLAEAGYQAALEPLRQWKDARDAPV